MKNFLLLIKLGHRKGLPVEKLACNIPLVTKLEVEKALKGMKRGKAAGDTGTAVYQRREEILFWKSLLYYFQNA